MRYSLEIYLKEKRKIINPQIVRNNKWKIETNNKEDLMRFLNRMVPILPQDKRWVIMVEFSWNDRKSTAYCYNIREYHYYCMGFEQYYRLLI